MERNMRNIMIASTAGMSVAAAAASLAFQSAAHATEDIGKAFLDIEPMIPYGDPGYMLGYGPRIRGTGRSGGQQKSRDVAKGRRAAKAARKARRVTRHAK